MAYPTLLHAPEYPRFSLRNECVSIKKFPPSWVSDYSRQHRVSYFCSMVSAHPSMAVSCMAPQRLHIENINVSQCTFGLRVPSSLPDQSSILREVISKTNPANTKSFVFSLAYTVQTVEPQLHSPSPIKYCSCITHDFLRPIFLQNIQSTTGEHTGLKLYAAILRPDSA